MKRIGVDPGLQGALALLNDNLELIEVVDMPVMAMGKHKNQVNSAELGKLLSRWHSQKGAVTVYLEAVHSMPGQGVSACFNFGDSFGCIRGVCGALQIPIVLVTPQSWKKRAGLLNKPKDYARTLAQQLYPSAELGRKKDIGRADAILIARYGTPPHIELEVFNISEMIRAGHLTNMH